MILSIEKQRQEIIFPFIIGYIQKFHSNIEENSDVSGSFMRNTKSIAHYRLSVSYTKGIRKMLPFLIPAAVSIAAGAGLFIFINLFAGFFALTGAALCILAGFYYNLVKDHKYITRNLRTRFQENLEETNNQLTKNVRQNSALKEAFDRVNKLSMGILSSLDMKDIIQRILVEAKRLLQSERATLFMYNKEQHEFSAELYEENVSIKFSAEHGIVGKIGKLKETIIMNDPYSSPFFNRSVDKKSSFITRNLIGTPILDDENNLLAVIEVVNKIKEEYDSVDEDILATICNYLSLAFQRVTLFHKKIEEEHKRLLSIMGSFITGPEFNAMTEISPTENRPDLQEWVAQLRYLSDIFTGEIDYTLETIDPAVFFQQQFIPGFTSNNVYSDEPFQADPEKLTLAIQKICQNAKDAAGDVAGKRCDIYYLTNVSIPHELIYEYGISQGVTAWNNATIKLADTFIDYVQGEFPLLQEQVDILKEKVTYAGKILILDNCGGIEPDRFQKLFYPFFTSKEDHIGMSLQWVRTLFNQVSVDFKITNNHPRGLEITILFP